MGESVFSNTLVHGQYDYAQKTTTFPPKNFRHHLSGVQR